MRFIWRYLRKYKWMIVLVVTVKLAGSIGDLLIPYVLEHMIDNIVPLNDAAKILGWGIVMILLAIAVRAANVMANRRATLVAKESTYELRRDLFWKTLNLSGSQIDEVGLPSLTSRMTADSYNVQNFIRVAQSIGIRAPILLLGGIVVTMTMDWGLSMILCIMAPIMIALVVFVSVRGIPLYEKVQQCVDGIVRVMRENITGIRVVKALSKENHERARFAGENEQMTKQDIKASVVMALPGPIATLFLNIGLTIVVYVGAVRVNSGVTKPGVILAFLTYFNMILMGVMGLNRVFMQMSKANASAARIAAVLAMEDEMAPIQDGEKCPHPEDFIVFDHVGFNYGGAKESDSADREKCLSDVSFCMKKGASLGIIGPTGCGKTTIINLLMRFYDAEEGGIWIDGKDVRSYGKEELHRMFGVAFQNDTVFADTVRTNISFGRDASEQDIWDAAQDAQAKDFLEQYPEGLDYKAAIHGANFSGGQRQRILIARALAGKPQILVLDDSSSALDYKTDAALRAAIQEHHKDTTMIVVAQRVSSIMGLDDILVMDEGRIIGHGTHEQLMGSCGAYREIYQTQMGGGV